MIDHTLLKPDATQGQIVKLCNEAKEHKFYGVCINSCWLPLTKQELSGSVVAAVAVIGFPLGAMSMKTKTFEAGWCAQNGAQEIDMVINIGQLKDKNYSFVQKDISEVVRAGV